MLLTSLADFSAAINCSRYLADISWCWAMTFSWSGSVLMFMANSNIALRPYLVRVESFIASSYYSYYISSILHETKAALLAEKRKKMKKRQKFLKYY